MPFDFQCWLLHVVPGTWSMSRGSAQTFVCAAMLGYIAQIIIIMILFL